MKTFFTLVCCLSLASLALGQDPNDPNNPNHKKKKNANNANAAVANQGGGSNNSGHQEKKAGGKAALRSSGGGSFDTGSANNNVNAGNTRKAGKAKNAGAFNNNTGGADASMTTTTKSGGKGNKSGTAGNMANTTGAAATGGRGHHGKQVLKNAGGDTNPDTTNTTNVSKVVRQQNVGSGQNNTGKTNSATNTGKIGTAVSTATGNTGNNTDKTTATYAPPPPKLPPTITKGNLQNNTTTGNTGATGATGLTGTTGTTLKDANGNPIIDQRAGTTTNQTIKDANAAGVGVTGNTGTTGATGATGNTGEPENKWLKLKDANGNPLVDPKTGQLIQGNAGNTGNNAGTNTGNTGGGLKDANGNPIIDQRAGTTTNQTIKDATAAGVKVDQNTVNAGGGTTGNTGMTMNKTPELTDAQKNMIGGGNTGNAGNAGNAAGADLDQALKDAKGQNRAAQEALKHDPNNPQLQAAAKAASTKFGSALAAWQADPANAGAGPNAAIGLKDSNGNPIVDQRTGVTTNQTIKDATAAGVQVDPNTVNAGNAGNAGNQGGGTGNVTLKDAKAAGLMGDPGNTAGNAGTNTDAWKLAMQDNPNGPFPTDPATIDSLKADAAAHHTSPEVMYGAYKAQVNFVRAENALRNDPNNPQLQKAASDAEQQYGHWMKDIRNANGGNPNQNTVTAQAAIFDKDGNPVNDAAKNLGNGGNAGNTTTGTVATGTNTMGNHGPNDFHNGRNPGATGDTTTGTVATGTNTAGNHGPNDFHNGRNPGATGGTATLHPGMKLNGGGTNDHNNGRNPNLAHNKPANFTFKTRTFNFAGKPRNNNIVSVQFHAGNYIPESQNWNGPKYGVFKTYKSEWHDHDWWQQNHGNDLVLVGGGYYYRRDNYWFPAWGYDQSASFYAYDGPIYAHNNLPPDQVVANVQSALQELGYYQDGEVDGLLGPKTRQALIQFQTDNQMQPTGSVDQPTLESLGMV